MESKTPKNNLNFYFSATIAKTVYSNKLQGRKVRLQGCVIKAKFFVIHS
jgi:hypothetical protein